MMLYMLWKVSNIGKSKDTYESLLNNLNEAQKKLDEYKNNNLLEIQKSLEEKYCGKCFELAEKQKYGKEIIKVLKASGDMMTAVVIKNSLSEAFNLYDEVVSFVTIPEPATGNFIEISSEEFENAYAGIIKELNQVLGIGGDCS